MVYAQLIHSQLAAVLNFLCSVPGPTGESALHFVLTEWLSRQHVFYGAYENKVRFVLYQVQSDPGGFALTRLRAGIDVTLALNLVLVQNHHGHPVQGCLPQFYLETAPYNVF